jgi:hypothetical protein
LAVLSYLHQAERLAKNGGERAGLAAAAIIAVRIDFSTTLGFDEALSRNQYTFLVSRISTHCLVNWHPNVGAAAERASQA